jgi:hypothetical protein
MGRRDVVVPEEPISTVERLSGRQSACERDCTYHPYHGSTRSADAWLTNVENPRGELEKHLYPYEGADTLVTIDSTMQGEVAVFYSFS